MSRPLSPAPGELEPWRLLGYLESRLNYLQTLDVAEWNAAVLACTVVPGEVNDSA
jgi:hypothetical protein